MIDFFTRQEKIFISFLLLAIIVGSAIKLYRSFVKTNEVTFRPENIDAFEKRFLEKAAEIDSSMAQRSLSLATDNVVINRSTSGFTKSVKKADQKNLLVEINTATIDELVQLPQIGPVIASRIVEYRNNYGSFKNINDLIKVKGVGEKKLKSIKPFIYIKPQ